MEDSPAAASLLRKCTRHGLVHPGTKASIRLITERFAWNGLQKGIREWMWSFIPCQTIQAHRHNNAPIGNLLPPTHAFIMCILIWSGPYPHHNSTVSFSPVWIASHYFVKPSRWSTVTPRPSSSPSCRTGTFPKFESTLFAKMCKFLGYERIDCSPTEW